MSTHNQNKAERAKRYEIQESKNHKVYIYIWLRSNIAVISEFQKKRVGKSNVKSNTKKCPQQIKRYKTTDSGSLKQFFKKIYPQVLHGKLLKTKGKEKTTKRFTKMTSQKK